RLATSSPRLRASPTVVPRAVRPWGGSRARLGSPDGRRRRTPEPRPVTRDQRARDQRARTARRRQERRVTFRVAIGGISTESSTFAPHRTTLDEFFVRRGPSEMWERYPFLETETAGWRLPGRPDVELVPLLHA